MSGITVNRVAPATITAVQVTQSTAQDVALVFEQSTLLGYRSTVLWYADGGTGRPTWMATISKEGYADQVAYNNYWLVIESGVLTVYPPQDFVNTFTTDIPMLWTATSTPPTASALPGGEARIVFPCPSSANGPFDYAVQVTDENTQASSAATLVGDPAVDADGHVTLTVSGLTVDDVCSFAVTVTTPYQGVGATSLPSNPITAIE